MTTPRRRARSSIQLLPDEVRNSITALLRDDRHTLDEVLCEIRDQFGDAATPSRSALGRYKQSVDTLMQRQREFAAASEALVAELGEDMDDRGAGLLAQAVGSLVTGALMDAQDKEVNAQDALSLARAAREALSARKLSREERGNVRREALTQAAQAAGAAARKHGLSKEAAEEIRAELLGLRA